MPFNANYVLKINALRDDFIDYIGTNNTMAPSLEKYKRKVYDKHE